MKVFLYQSALGEPGRTLYRTGVELDCKINDHLLEKLAS